MPSLRRFERMAARAVFARPLVGRILARALPLGFTGNAVAGYLLPDLVESGVARYVVLALRRL